MDIRKSKSGAKKALLQTPVCEQPANMSTGATMQPIGLHTKDQKVFEFFEKILSKEGPMDLSGPKIKEYTNRFPNDFHRRIHSFGGLGKFLSSDPRFCVSLNVARLATPMKQSVSALEKPSDPTQLKQIEVALKQNVTPTENPWKIDPPSQCKKSSNDYQFRVVPDNDFCPRIISNKSDGNNHTLPVSENINRPQGRLFENHTRDRQSEDSSELVLTRDDTCTASHGVPIQFTSFSERRDRLQPMVQNTSESVPLPVHTSYCQTQVHEMQEEILDQRADKSFFPSAYDSTELDTTSLITEFTESLSSSQTASSSEEETVPHTIVDSASLSQGSVKWSPTKDLINSFEAGLSTNSSSVMLPINYSPMAGFPMIWTPITDLHMKWPPIKGLPMSWSQIIARPERSSVPGPTMDSSAELDESRSHTVCLNENMSQTEFLHSRSQATGVNSKSPTGLAESRSQAGFTESLSPGFIVNNSPRAEFTKSGLQTAEFTENGPQTAEFTWTSQKAGLIESKSHTPQLTDSWTQTTMLPKSSPSIGSNKCLSPRLPSLSQSAELFDNRSTENSEDSSSTVLYGNLSGTEICEISPTPPRPVYLSSSRGVPVSWSPLGLATNSTPKETTGLSKEHSHELAINDHSLHANSMNDFVSPVKTELRDKSGQDCFESPYENGSLDFNSDQTKHNRQSVSQVVESADNHLDQSSDDQWSIGKTKSINTFLSLPNVISEINLILTDFKSRICALNIPTLPQNSFSAEYSKDSESTRVMSSEAVYRIKNLPEGNSQYPNSSCFSEAPGCNCQSDLPVHGKLDYHSAQGFEIECEIDGSVCSEAKFTAPKPQIHKRELTAHDSQADFNETVGSKVEFTTVKPRIYFNGTVGNGNILQALKTQTYINGAVDSGTELKPTETQTYISEQVGNKNESKTVKIMLNINGAVENAKELKASETHTDFVRIFNNGSEFQGVKIQIDFNGTGGNGRKYTIESQTDIDGIGHNQGKFKDIEAKTDIIKTVDERELQEVKVVYTQTETTGIDIVEQFTQLNFLKDMQTICRIENEELVKENEATKDMVKTLQEQLQNVQDELDHTKFENDDLERQVVHMTYLLEKNEKADADDFDCEMITQKLLKSHHDDDMPDVKQFHKGKYKKKRKGKK